MSISVEKGHEKSTFGVYRNRNDLYREEKLWAGLNNLKIGTGLGSDLVYFIHVQYLTPVTRLYHGTENTVVSIAHAQARRHGAVIDRHWIVMGTSV